MSQRFKVTLATYWEEEGDHEQIDTRTTWVTIDHDGIVTWEHFGGDDDQLNDLQDDADGALHFATYFRPGTYEDRGTVYPVLIETMVERVEGE